MAGRTKKLTEKQQLFIQEYLKDLNATQAAIRAGYAPKRADAFGWNLLRKVEVSQAIQSAVNRRLARLEITADRLLAEAAKMLYADPRAYFDAQGKHLPIHLLGDAEAAALASWEVIIKNAAAGDGQTDTVLKTKRWDKTKVWELLARHLGLLSERVEVTHGLSEDLLERLREGRERVAEESRQLKLKAKT